MALSQSEKELLLANLALAQASWFDLIRIQRAFSYATFGTGKRTEGILQHIQKEIEEVRRAPNDLEEWIDLMKLALDGAHRCLGPDVPADEAAAKIILTWKAKAYKNISRDWPPAPPEDQASLHIKNRVYLAAAFEDIESVREVRTQLHLTGYIVTSRWLDSVLPQATEAYRQGIADREQVRAWAKNDQADILAADIFVIFTQPDTQPICRGGRLTELGIAMQAGKKIVVVGPFQNIFTFCADETFVSAAELLEYLRNEQISSR